MKPGNEGAASKLLQVLGLTGTWLSDRACMELRGFRNADRFFEMVREHMHKDLFYKLEAGYRKSRFYLRFGGLYNSKEEFWNQKLIQNLPMIQSLRSKGHTLQYVARAVGIPEDRLKAFASQQNTRFESWRYGYTDSQLEALHKFAGTMTDTEAAAKVGVSIDFVTGVRKRHGIPKWNQTATKVSRHLSDLPKRLAESSIHAVAKEVGMCPKALTRYVRDNDIPYVSPLNRTGDQAQGWGRWKAEIDEEELRKCAKTMDKLTLAKHFGVGWRTIDLRLQRYGLTAAPKGARPHKRIPKEVLEDMLRRGLRRKDMLVELGYGSTILSREMRRHGLEFLQSRKNMGPKKKTIPKEVLESLLQRGLRRKDMLAEVKVSGLVLDREMKRHGLEFLRRRKPPSPSPH
jgi:hypothetical protein